MAGSGEAPLRAADRRRLLTVKHLEVEFRLRRGKRVHAVSDVSFDLLRGETLGLVGESGSGKSTTGLAIMQLVHSQHGDVEFDGVDLSSLGAERLRELRPQFQMIFQDPFSSLNPRRKVRNIVAEPMTIWPDKDSQDRGKRVTAMLDSVGLDGAHIGDRRPRELSGGQAQRVSIARALMLNPSLLVCDEPVSALDVSVQAQILNLLEDLKQRYDLSLLFISHDLAVVKNVSDRLAVMYLGKLCEVGETETVYRSPAHPYTRVLLDSAPRIDDTAVAPPILSGEIPSPIDPPSGCRFRTRCPRATELCSIEEPTMVRIAPDQFVACHHPLQQPAPANHYPLQQAVPATTRPS